MYHTDFAIPIIMYISIARKLCAIRIEETTLSRSIEIGAMIFTRERRNITGSISTPPLL